MVSLRTGKLIGEAGVTEILSRLQGRGLCAPLLFELICDLRKCGSTLCYKFGELKAAE